MATEVIVNGTFDAGTTGWSGKDMEASLTEHTYLCNANRTNKVAEINGGKDKITVMKQSFTFDDPLVAPLFVRCCLAPLCGHKRRLHC